MATGLIYFALLTVCCIPGGIAYAVSDWRTQRVKTRGKKAASQGGERRAA